MIRLITRSILNKGSSSHDMKAIKANLDFVTSGKSKNHPGLEEGPSFHEIMLISQEESLAQAALFTVEGECHLGMSLWKNRMLVHVWPLHDGENESAFRFGHRKYDKLYKIRCKSIFPADEFKEHKTGGGDEEGGWQMTVGEMIYHPSSMSKSKYQRSPDIADESQRCRKSGFSNEPSPLCLNSN